MDKTTQILKERGKEYGYYNSMCETIQSLKNRMKVSSGWTNLSCSQKESLDMIAHKIGRILNGNPDNIDSWQDIEGYARLIREKLEDKI